MRGHRIVPLLAAVAALTACERTLDTVSAEPVGPLSLLIVSGDSQTAAPRTMLPKPLVARVQDSQGKPVKGQIVNFRVAAGGGQVFAGAAITNESGIAQERWTVGEFGPQRVEARAVDTETGDMLTFGVFNAFVTGSTTSNNTSAGLKVLLAGSGKGSLTSQPGGLTCSVTECHGTYPLGTRVTLTPIPKDGSVFKGWESIGCAALAACIVELKGPMTITARFDTVTGPGVTVSVARAGTGWGIVHSTPAGLNCGFGSTCTGTWPAETIVTLVAKADSMSNFAGWTPACATAGTVAGSCSYKLTAPVSVTATFNKKP